MADLRAFLRWSEKRSMAAGSPLDLATDDIHAYCAYLQHTKDHAPATVNRKLQTLRKFYDLGVEQGWTETNPAQDVPLLGEVLSDRSRLLTPDDVSVLLKAIQGSRSRWASRDWAIIQVLVGAGLKLGELTELHLGDVHLGAEPPCLDVCVDSGGVRRSLPLAADVCAALRSYLAARQAASGIDHLFVNRDGNPLSTRSVQRLLHRYARAAGLDSLTTQALRYLYARRVYEQSRDLEAVAELLGHRHLATTARYLRPHSDE
jgi:integrase/recombinase XerC